jgi:cytosine/adenosine deaminase-related metal-dependent hydrolase
VSIRRRAESLRSLTTASATTTLYRAPWVVTVDPETDLYPGQYSAADPRLLIADGGVCVADGRIIAVGPFVELIRDQSSAAVVDFEDTVFIPPLVNAHVHLELSHLAGAGEAVARQGDLPAWIRTLIAQREQCRDSEAEIIRAGQQALDHLYATGTGLLADIGNRSTSIAIGRETGINICFFLELLGMSQAAAQQAMAVMDREGARGVHCTVHAPYSCSSTLIRTVKERARQQQRLFPLHVAESAAEIEFLRSGTGGFRDLLIGRGVWDESFVPLDDHCGGAIDYLHRLGVLDTRTLCVHAVHVSKEEIALLAAQQVKVCLCPGSNRYLGVGRAPVTEMLAAGILPALGTDSLASNHELNLWQEMKILRTEHPDLQPAAVFAMATRGGAEALGYGESSGRLRPGAPGSFLAVQCPGLNRSEIFEHLTTIGRRAQPVWVGSGIKEQLLR